MHAAPCVVRPRPVRLCNLPGPVQSRLTHSLINNNTPLHTSPFIPPVSVRIHRRTFQDESLMRCCARSLALSLSLSLCLFLSVSHFRLTIHHPDSTVVHHIVYAASTHPACRAVFTTLLHACSHMIRSVFYFPVSFGSVGMPTAFRSQRTRGVAAVLGAPADQISTFNVCCRPLPSPHAFRIRRVKSNRCVRTHRSSSPCLRLCLS